MATTKQTEAAILELTGIVDDVIGIVDDVSKANAQDTLAAGTLLAVLATNLIVLARNLGYEGVARRVTEGTVEFLEAYGIDTEGIWNL